MKLPPVAAEVDYPIQKNDCRSLLRQSFFYNSLIVLTKEKLLVNCEDSWSKLGYKKTNIEDLCAKAGISKGAFYLFYASKEELFFDVIMRIQTKLVYLTKATLGETPTKESCVIL